MYRHTAIDVQTITDRTRGWLPFLRWKDSRQAAVTGTVFEAWQMAELRR